MQISPQRRAEMEETVLSDDRIKEIRGDVIKLEERANKIKVGPNGVALLALINFLTERRILQSRMIAELLEATKEPTQ